MISMQLPLHLGNATRDGLFQVEQAAATGDTTTLTFRASLLGGRGRLTGVDEKQRKLVSDTRFQFDAAYRGAWLVNESRQVFVPLKQSGGGGLIAGGQEALTPIFGDPATARREFWISYAGPGDQVRLERATTTAVK